MDAHVQIHVNSFGNKSKSKKKYRARRCRMRAGWCVAAIKAVTAAEIYIAGKTSSSATAAVRCGSCRPYVQAAIVLLQSEDTTVLERVLRGHVPLLTAARQLKQIANLVNAYRAASAADRVAFARTIGPTTLFDGTLVPAL